MPDIAMCNHPTCPSRETCRRNAASGTKPSEDQSYMDIAVLPGMDRCGFYWPTRETKAGRAAEKEGA